MKRVAVVGSSGFIGSGVMKHLGRRGVPVTCPRIRTHGRTVEQLHAEVARLRDVVAQLADQLEGCSAVVIAAGYPDAGARDSDELFGANSLAPLLVTAAAARAGCKRVVHVSSAVVQGAKPVLDDQPALEGFSPYSCSKVLAERALLAQNFEPYEWPGLVIYRPPSVHAPERRITRALIKVANSPFASVGGDGTAPTPQALHENVCSAIEFLADVDDPPEVVHHPWEGVTVESLLMSLSGSRPRRVPWAMARVVSRSLRFACRLSPLLRPHSRRLELLWLGQQQADSWLTSAGWQPAAEVERWSTLTNAGSRDAREASTGPESRLLFVISVGLIAVPVLREQVRYFSKREVDVHVLAAGDPALATMVRDAGGTFHDWRIARAFSGLAGEVRTALQLCRSIKAIRPSVLVAGTPKAGLFGVAAGRFLRVPRVLYTLHGLRLEGARGLRRAALWLMEFLACRCAHEVHVVGEDLLARAQRLRLIGARSGKVIGAGSASGINVERFRPMPGDEGSHVASEGSKRCIGFVGRVTHDKGLPHLLSLARHLKDLDIPATLCVVGEPDYSHPADRRLVAELMALDNVSFLGHRSDVERVFPQFDLLVLPSLREGLPTVVLDAAACGVPACMFACTGAKDAIDDGRTGVIVDLGDSGAFIEATLNLVCDGETLERYGREARLRVENLFSSAQFLPSLAEFYFAPSSRPLSQ